jgi:lipid-A-disaccharide synthase
MIVAGEASGDLHAAKLVKALRENFTATGFEFFGATSRHLRQAGVEQIVNADELSVVGLPEIGVRLPMFWKAFQRLKKTAVERKTEVAILVDFPDFNLKLAKSLKKRGIKVIYYISPQLWAWREYRKKIVEKYVDLLLTILPFEKDWYAQQGIFHVEYVGNPTVREVHPRLSKEEFCQRHSLDPQKPIVSLLPGSRHKELVRILPVLLDAAALIVQKNAAVQFVIALASTRKTEEVENIIKSRQNLSLPARIITVRDETYEALNASDAAAVTSGTATLETAIIGTPMAIVYKTSSINYKLLRPLISVEHFGLINLIAGERLVKELIQDDFTPEALAEEIFCLLKPKINSTIREKLKQATDKLGHGGASKRAAYEIMKFLRK